jgi:hypothetical protein
MILERNKRKFWGISIEKLIGLIDRENSVVSLGFSLQKRMSFGNGDNEKNALNMYFSAHMGDYQILPKEKHKNNLSITLGKSKNTYKGYVAIGYSIFHSMYPIEFRGESRNLYDLLVHELERRGMDKRSRSLWRILVKSVKAENDDTTLNNIIKNMTNEPKESMRNYIRVTVFAGLFNSSNTRFSESRMKYVIDDLMRVTRTTKIRRANEKISVFHTIVPIICDPLRGRMFTKFSFLVFYNSSL